jgi:hypothetical protein
VLHDGTKEIVGGIHLDVQGQGTAVEPRDIQQIGHKTIQPISLLFNYERPLVTQRLELVGESLDRRQGRSQIVREGSEERILELVCLAERLRPLHSCTLGAGTIQQLGGDEARYEKSDEDDPVGRIADK